MSLIYFIPVLTCCLSCAAHSERLQPIEQGGIESVNASVTIQSDTISDVYASVSRILGRSGEMEHNWD